ncbi:MAG: sugar transferase [Acidobacteriota bacterium]|nr:sugar transferase [Acidobacteriota bacterium]
MSNVGTRAQVGQAWITAFSSDMAPSGAGVLAGLERRRSTHRQRDEMSRRRTSVPPGFGTWAPPATVKVHAGRSRVRARKQATGVGHVLAQDLFRDVLAREQKCSERFNQRVVLLLVSAGDLSSGGATSGSPAQRWSHVVQALSAAAGETAVIGWLETDAVLGASMPGMPGVDPEARLRGELGRRLSAESVARLAIRSHVYSPERRLRPSDCCQPATSQRESQSADNSRTRDAVKRALDLLISVTLLVLLLPVFLLIAALQKLSSPGPILFRQPRVGQTMKPFMMLKFRSMRVNADQALHQEFVTKFIRSGAQLHSAGRKAVYKLTDDPRITPLGRVLRKTSLDELPQLWNVVRGEMSLVGPRPPLAYEVEQYHPWHWRRVVDAKPGITGLWQVKGRSRTTFDEMVRLDIRYAKNYSLWMDIKILLATPGAVFSGKGAA